MLQNNDSYPRLQPAPSPLRLPLNLFKYSLLKNVAEN